MKNTSWLKVLIISLSIVTAGFFIGEMNWNSLKNNRKVQVKGLSEREVKANLAVWPMQITITNNNLSNLNSEIESQKRKVLAFFTNRGFTKSEINIGISNITDTKANLYNNGAKQNFRYLARTEITLRTKNIQKIKNAQKESINLASEGILINSKNQWRPVEYIYTGLNSIKPEMIEEATKKAKEVAEKFAKDSNSKVGKIKSATQGLFTINDRDSNTPDVKKVRVVTTVNYFLED
jgi:hypothetical protein